MSNLKKIISFPGNTGDYKLKEAVAESNDDDTDIQTSLEHFTDEASKGDSICNIIANQFKTTELDDVESFSNPCRDKKRKTHEKFREVLTFSGEILFTNAPCN